jgi:hypothetical protein
MEVSKNTQESTLPSFILIFYKTNFHSTLYLPLRPLKTIEKEWQLTGLLQ